MDTLAALLTFASFILFLIGLVSPKTSLFWLKSNRNRKISSAVYGLLIISGIVLFQITYTPGKLTNNNQAVKTEAVSSAEEKMPESKELETIVNSNEASNVPDSLAASTAPSNEASNEPVVTKYIAEPLTSKWYKLKPSKKESYTEDKLDGEWHHIFSVRYGEDGFDRENFEIKKGNYFYEKFVDKMLPEYYYEFSQKNTIKSNTKEKMSYVVEDSTIKYLNPGHDQEIEKVLFIGDALLVRQSELETIKLGHYSFSLKSSQTDFAVFNQELKQFQTYLLVRADELFTKAVQSINLGQQIEGFNTVNIGYSLLTTTSLIDSSLNREVSARLSVIKPVIDSLLPAYIERELVQIKARLESTKLSDRVNYLNKIKESYSIVSNLKAMASNFGVKSNSLEAQNANLTKMYDKELKEVKLYGDGLEGMMKYAVMEEIKQWAKDPGSIKAMKTGYKKGSKGIIYQIMYRGKNSFGGYTVDSKTYLLNFDVSSSTYYVVKEL